jgi:hypothetical protein
VSKQRHGSASLPGFSGPFFPDSVDGLGGELDRGGFSEEWLGLVDSAVPGFIGLSLDATTSDGYPWYRRMEFIRESGRVIVLIPHSQDRDQDDGTRADRSIAVYTDPDIEGVMYEALARELLAAAKRQRDAEDRALKAGTDVQQAEQHRRRMHGLLPGMVVAQVDGTGVDTTPTHVSGRQLNIELLVRSQWPQRQDLPDGATLVAFKTPVWGYRELTDGLAPEDGCLITLGGLPTYIGSSNHIISVDLTPEHYYDVFLLGHNPDGTCSVIGWVRYATVPGESELPRAITLDEARLITLLHLRFTRHIGEFLPVTASRMCVWDDYGCHDALGFDFRPIAQEGPSASRYGVVVHENGYAQSYDGRTAEDIRAHLGY